MSRKPLTSSPAFQLKKCSRNFVDDPKLKLEIPLMSGEKNMFEHWSSNYHDDTTHQDGEKWPGF